MLEAGGAPPGFAAKLLGDDRNPAQIFPEETLLARLETGDLDAAFLYATESTARHLPAVELPDTANLGDPAQRRARRDRQPSPSAGSSAGAPPPPTRSRFQPSRRNADGGAAFVNYLFSAPGNALLRASGISTLRPTLVGDRSAVPSSVRSEFAP